MLASDSAFNNSRAALMQSKCSAKTYINQNGNQRNLPSNNTICEVSEKDSEFDDRSKVTKRNEPLAAINISPMSCYLNTGNEKKLNNNIINSNLNLILYIIDNIML